MAEKFFAFLGTLQFGFAATFLGGVVWLTEIHFTTEASAKAIELVALDVQAMKIKIEQDKSESQRMIYEKLTEIDKRLSRIEGQLLR